MSIKDRLQMVIKMNNLTNAQFADRVGVQRSSISHIMAGRNKPSLDFIQKTLEAFPRVNAKWLITGKQDRNELSNDHNADNVKETSERKDSSSPLHNDNSAQSKTQEKSIKRIVVYYEDGSYVETLPSTDVKNL